MTPCGTVLAQQIGVAALLSGRATLVIDGQAVRTVAVGQTTPEGVKLVAIENGAAVVEIAGKRESIRLGQNASGVATAGQTVVLTAERGGHFTSMGSINGVSVQFVVDTGASMISIGAADARRIGLDAVGGERAWAQTANGVIAVTRLRLKNVRVGGISLDGVDALIHENDLPVVLLGMSFLSRTDMLREGSTLTLRKRY